MNKYLSSEWKMSIVLRCSERIADGILTKCQVGQNWAPGLKQRHVIETDWTWASSGWTAAWPCQGRSTRKRRQHFPNRGIRNKETVRGQ